MLLAIITCTRTRIVLPPDARYFWALLYLSVLGSVVGFTTYLSLVARVGPSRAAYTTVLFPVVALAVSTVYEGYRWHWTGVLGLAIALCGNVVIFSGAPKRPLGCTRRRRRRRSLRERRIAGDDAACRGRAPDPAYLHHGFTGLLWPGTIPPRWLNISR